MTYRIMLLVELTKLSDMSDNLVVIKSVLRKGMLGGNILAQLAGFYVVGTKPITEFPQNQPRNIMTGKTAVWHKLPSKTVLLII